MCGAATIAVVHGNTAYFSHGYNVYSYTLSQDKWTQLKECEYQSFSMAVVNNQLTTIGGRPEFSIATNTVLCLSRSGKWEELLPPMPTPRAYSAAVTTPTYLIVAGGSFGGALSVVETLDTNTLQWSSVSSSPKPLMYPNMTLCNGLLYLSEHNKIFSCSVEKLLKSTEANCSLWNQLADIPVPYWTSLTTMRGRVITIGGSDHESWGTTYTPSGAIHQYNRSTNSWSVVGEMPTPRVGPLVAVLPSHELIVVGGCNCNVTEIASSTY